MTNKDSFSKGLLMKAKRLCTICARGGSKGLKNKNLRDFFGKPLISHTVSIAKAAHIFDLIAVSSDSPEILEAARDSGADYLIKRPFELATDNAAKLPAIQHCAREVQILSGLAFDSFVDLSVTSPLMLPEDVRGAVQLLENSKANNVITGSLTHHSPYFSMVEKTDNGFVKLVKSSEGFVRRQDCPPCYEMNGAIYVWDSAQFYAIDKVITESTLVYEMPAERSIDIDTELDFQFACFLYAKRTSIATKNTIVL